MGYTTWFDGYIETKDNIPEDLRDYVNEFCRIRHMKRDVERIKEVYPDWKDHCYNGELGRDGEFFITPKYVKEEFVDKNDISLKFAQMYGEEAPEGYVANPFGQIDDGTVLDHNNPGGDCPGLWCQWEVADNIIAWNQGEKFYNYIEWLAYLLYYFFTPNNIMFNGKIYWQGEKEEDVGLIVVENNQIFIGDDYAEAENA